MRVRFSPTLIPAPALVLALALTLTAAALAAALAPAPAAAVIGGDDPDADTVYEKPEPEKDITVERIQERLRGIGLYKGPVDGRGSAALSKAIRAYERASGRDVTGAATQDLLDALDEQSNIRNLLGRLAESRRRSVETARSALSRHPATRDLLQGDYLFRADPTRDPNMCFDTPTVRCLLLEAETAARTVYKSGLRDWALGEVLAAQARAGLAEAARGTASRMTDPRLIMNALNDIARAMAGSGLYADALEAASVIPDDVRRAETLMTVLRTLAKIGGDESARPTISDAAAAGAVIKRLTAVLDALPPDPKTVALRARMAAAMARLQRAGGASEQITEAERAAREDLDEKDRGGALRAVAGALADMRRPERALAVLAHTKDSAARAPVLMSAAAALAEAGDAAAALAAAGAIDEVRYRTVVLARIAKAQFALGDGESAMETLDLAGAAVENIRMPFARSYALGRVTEALAEISDSAAEFDGAVLVAGRIDDPRLRAQAFWAVARRQKERGMDSAGAEALAEDAVKDVRSALSRAWAYADLAEARAGRGDAEGAWSAFYSGLNEARNIKNDWRRARALARIAMTLVDVVDGAVDAAPGLSPDGG